MPSILSPVSFNKRQQALIDALVERVFPAKAWGREEDLETLWALALDLERDLALYIDRRGQVQALRIESRRDPLFFTPPERLQEKGLLGWRLLATDLRGGPQALAEEEEALRQWHYDSMGVLYSEAEAVRLRTHLLQVGERGFAAEIHSETGLPLSAGADRSMGQAIQDLEKSLDPGLRATDHGPERAILVLMPSEDEDLVVLSDELAALAETAGVEVVGVMHQAHRTGPKKLGRGKIKELQAMIHAEEANVVLFDNPLTPALHRDMTKALGVKVLDKTALILDIFALRASSREGKLQVELAQLNYLLPRLTGKGQELSRLGGGVGTRGPGETQLETDRRHIRRRMTTVRHELETVSQDRATQRRARDQSGLMRFALVGYTNAGKSSLLNALAGSDLYAQDQLFATLDAATRLVTLPSGEQLLMSDTVGFIRDLPPELLDAFKSTLEELRYVDVLLHVVDASAADIDERVSVVEETLKNLNLEEKPLLTVLNKIDAMESWPLLPPEWDRKECLALSARTGQGLDDLEDRLESLVRAREKTEVFYLPYGDSTAGRLTAAAHESGRILEKAYDEGGVQLTISLRHGDPLWQELAPYRSQD